MDLDTSATTTGGAVTLGVFDDTGGSGYINTLDIDTSDTGDGSAPGMTTLHGGIQLSDNGTGTSSSLIFTGAGDVAISDTLTVDLSSSTVGTNAGGIDFGGSLVRADLAGWDLTIDTLHSGASSGGSIQGLASVAEGAGMCLDTLTIDMNSDTGVDGTLSFSSTDPEIEVDGDTGGAQTTIGVEIIGDVTVPTGGSLTIDTNPDDLNTRNSGAIDLDSARLDGNGEVFPKTSGDNGTPQSLTAGNVLLGNVGATTPVSSLTVDVAGATAGTLELHGRRSNGGRRDRDWTCVL